MNGGGLPELSSSSSPNTQTAISFSHSNVGGAGLACRCVGGGEWQGGALRDGGGCPESVWGGEVCKSSNSGANGGSSQPTPRAGGRGRHGPSPKPPPRPPWVHELPNAEAAACHALSPKKKCHAPCPPTFSFPTKIKVSFSFTSCLLLVCWGMSPNWGRGALGMERRVEVAKMCTSP